MPQPCDGEANRPRASSGRVDPGDYQDTRCLRQGYDLSPFAETLIGEEPFIATATSYLPASYNQFTFSHSVGRKLAT